METRNVQVRIYLFSIVYWYSLIIRSDNSVYKIQTVFFNLTLYLPRFPFRSCLSLKYSSLQTEVILSQISTFYSTLNQIPEEFDKYSEQLMSCLFPVSSLSTFLYHEFHLRPITNGLQSILNRYDRVFHGYRCANVCE